MFGCLWRSLVCWLGQPWQLWRRPTTSLASAMCCRVGCRPKQNKERGDECLAAYGAHWFAGLGSRGSFGVWRHVVSEAQIGATVTDAELTKYLNITPEQAAIILPKLTT